jgi:hypothetical protein
MRAERAGGTSHGLAAKTIREIGVLYASHISPDLTVSVTRVLEGAVRHYRRTFGSSEEKRIQAWTAAFTEIFKLLGSRRMREQHADIGSFRKVLQTDRWTTKLLCYQGFLNATRREISSHWYNHVSLWIAKWFHEFEVRWMERSERRPSGLMSSQAQVYAADDPLAQFVPRDVRTMDTRTARRLEQFWRRMEPPGARRVRKADMLFYLGYKGYSMLQRVSRESPNASEDAIANVEEMLQCPSPGYFWRVVDRQRALKTA